MTRVLVVAILASCTKPAAPVHPDTTRPVTPLEVIVLDDFPTEPTCEGVAPHLIEVLVDEVVAATVTLACTTEVHVPPSLVHAVPFDVKPGKHVFRVRETARHLDSTLELELPVFDPPLGGPVNDVRHALATKLPVWANASELEIESLRVRMK